MKRHRLSELTASNPLTLTLLGASRVTVGTLAYRLSAPLRKTGSRSSASRGLKPFWKTITLFQHFFATISTGYPKKITRVKK